MKEYFKSFQRSLSALVRGYESQNERYIRSAAVPQLRMIVSR